MSEGQTAQQPSGGQPGEPPQTWPVVAMLLKEFNPRAVAEQAKLKSQLEALVALALQPLAPAERIVLDAPEGVVVVVLSGADVALDLAERAQAGAADLPLCIAAALGPVKVNTDNGSAGRLVGDGVVAALALANLATRGRVLISRPLRDALAVAAPYAAKRLASVGVLTDATLRAHELFAPDPRAARLARRQLMLGGGFAVLGILAAGVALRWMRAGSGPSAVIHFDISPSGEIFIDGDLKGESPPLRELSVRPGAHTIEVRNASHPPLILQTNLKPAEEIKVKHAFSGRRARKEGDSLFEDIRRRLWQ